MCAPSRKRCPDTNGRHDPPPPYETDTRSNRNPKELHAGVPPFQLSAVAIGRPAPGGAAQRDGLGDRLAVDPDTPPARPSRHLEHCDLVAASDRDALIEQVELRRRAFARDLGVDEGIHPGHRGDAGLDPLVAAVRPLPGASDADPAGNVAGLDGRGTRGRDRRPHAVTVVRGLVARVRVPAGAGAADARATGRGRRRGADERGDRQGADKQGEKRPRTHG